MTEQEILAEAIQRLNSGDFSGAEEMGRELLKRDSTHAKAWHLCGIVQAQQGFLDSAVEHFANATKFDIGNATYHFNLGLAYKGLGKLDQAVSAYRAAITVKCDFLEARNNLGNTLIEMGENRAATICFRELIELYPDSSDAHYNYANLLQDIGNFDESIDHYRRALEIDPTAAMARENLGRAFGDEGRLDEARQLWVTWLEREPDNPVARHMLASITGENPPSRCDDDFIRDTFNSEFAKTFDKQLARLDYKAPELVGNAFHSLRDDKAHFVDRHDLDILDAGCGTGLCASIFRPFARRIVGVDLSEEMLVEARKRNIYDETIPCELTNYMRSNPASMDLIVSADTLCYFGELSEVLQAAFACLKQNGLLIFTVEAMHAENVEMPVLIDRYQLKQNGRYCHSSAYVTQTLDEVGFGIDSVSPAVLRRERGIPVKGLVVVVTHPSN